MEDSQSRCSLCFWLITAQHQDGHMQDKFNSLPILLSFSFSMTNTKAISNSDNFKIYYFVIFPWGWFSSGWKSTPRKQPEFENPILRFDSQFGSSAVFFLFFFYFLILGCRNFFSNPIFLVVFLSHMWPFPWTKSYWQYSSSSLSLVPWNTCGMTKEGLPVMQSPTSFNKPCSPTPPTIPIHSPKLNSHVQQLSSRLESVINNQTLSNGECFLLTHANFRFPAFPTRSPTRIVKRTIDWIGATHPTHHQIAEFPVPSNTPGFCRFRFRNKLSIFSYSWYNHVLVRNWASWYLYLRENCTELSFNWSLLIPSIRLRTKLPPPLPQPFTARVKLASLALCACMDEPLMDSRRYKLDRGGDQPSSSLY